MKASARRGATPHTERGLHISRDESRLSKNAGQKSTGAMKATKEAKGVQYSCFGKRQGKLEAGESTVEKKLQNPSNLRLLRANPRCKECGSVLTAGAGGSGPPAAAHKPAVCAKEAGPPKSLAESERKNAVVIAAGEEQKVLEQISRIKLRSVTGAVIRAQELWSDRPALLLLLRRPGCMTCRAESLKLEQIANRLDALGVRRVAIVHEWVRAWTLTTYHFAIVSYLMRAFVLGNNH